MFDHVTLRVPDLAAATGALTAALDALEIGQTATTPSFSVWGNFALTQADEQHPITRRVHIAFIAPTSARVDRFGQAGSNAGFADDGPAGPRPKYAEDYYSASLKDRAGNGFEAVHRKGQRPGGNIDHVVLHVSDVEASTAFYSTIAGEPTQDTHIAFSGDDDNVRRFHADGIAAGYSSNGEPGERPRYHAGYYAAYVLDPDGNNIEFVNHHRRNAI